MCSKSAWLESETNGIGNAPVGVGMVPLPRRHNLRGSRSRIDSRPPQMSPRPKVPLAHQCLSAQRRRPCLSAVAVCASL